MNLLVDIGNSRIKWALADRERWHRGEPAEVIAGDPEPVFNRLWGELSAPDAIMACNVHGGGMEEAFAGWCQRNWGGHPRFLQPQAEILGIVCMYRDPGQLGCDRFAAILGARHQSPRGALAVIDCGTAVTVDVLDAQNRFRGGAIMPGIRSAQRALLRDTRGVKAVDWPIDSVLGRSTAECVGAGTLYGLAGGIARVITEAERELNTALQVFLTGGDTSRIRPLLDLRRDVTEDPDLVLRGLCAVLRGQP